MIHTKNIIKPIFIITTTILLLAVAAPLFSDSAFAADFSVPQTDNELYRGSVEQNPIILWINFFVNVFSVIVLVGSAVMIAVAGIQYSAARDNAQGVQAAKQKITNVVLGLLAYIFFFGFIQWLIPGGVF